jgi:predicted SAM-dependent methyltransferase
MGALRQEAPMKALKVLKYLWRPLRRAGMVETRMLDSTKKAVQKTEKYLNAASPPALHFGSGEKKLEGWLNLDIGGPADIHCDFTIPMRFLKPNSFQFAFSEHVLEHFSRPKSLSMAKQIHRSLRPGGVFRVAIPDLDNIIEAYKNYDGGLHRDHLSEFIQTYGESFKTRGEFFDLCMRGWGHQYIYNEEDLGLMLKKAGFSKVERKKHHDSEHDIFKGIETRPPGESALILEATK